MRPFSGTHSVEADPDDPAVVIRREAQLLVNYRDSTLVGGDADGGDADGGDADGGAGNGPRPGDRAPDRRGLQRSAVNHPLRLFELLADPHHTLLLYADDPAQLPVFAEIDELTVTLTGGRVRTYVITPTPELPATPSPVIVDAAGEFRTAYGASGGSGYLVRPDGHLGFRAASITATSLRSHFKRGDSRRARDGRASSVPRRNRRRGRGSEVPSLAATSLWLDLPHGSDQRLQLGHLELSPEVQAALAAQQRDAVLGLPGPPPPSKVNWRVTTPMVNAPSWRAMTSPRGNRMGSRAATSVTQAAGT